MIYLPSDIVPIRNDIVVVCARLIEKTSEVNVFCIIDVSHYLFLGNPGMHSDEEFERL